VLDSAMRHKVEHDGALEDDAPGGSCSDASMSSAAPPRSRHEAPFLSNSDKE